MFARGKSNGKGFSSVLVIIMIGVIALVAAGGWYLGRQTFSLDGTVPSTTLEERADMDYPEEGSLTNTIPGIIALGIAQECEWTLPTETEDNPFTTGKLWTDGAQARSSIVANVGGSEMAADAIYINNIAYTWMTFGDQKMGFQFSSENMADLDDSLTPEERQQAEQIQSELVFTCKPWTPDHSLFVLPQDIVFRES